MPVIVDEHTQYTDEGGKPLVNGNVFIGVANQDPVLNPEPIFSDRGLTVAIANPQALNSRGQTVNKIYVAGRYSFKLENSVGSQIEQDLDRGSTPAVGITSLTNVAGTNTITAEADPTIDAYEDKQEFSLTLINEPTGAMTLNIDGVGVVSIKKNGLEIQPNQLLANELIVVAFNIIGPVFELISGTRNLAEPLNTNGFSINESQGANVASATQPNIWVQDGNTVRMTGTDPVSTFTDAPRIGARATIIVDEDGVQFRHGLGITLQGGADILAKAGDRFEVYADAVDAFSGIFIRNVPPSPFATQLLHVRDEKAAGVDGGTFTSGAWQTRDLNTLPTPNEIIGASVASNQISLPAGKYQIIASAPAFNVANHKTRLRDISSSLDLVIGTPEYTASNTTQNRSFLSERFTLSVARTLEFQHQAGVTQVTNGLGRAGFFSVVEIYADVQIWKVG